MKTNKSYTKRIRVTKTGKLMTRKTGQNHFNAKERSSAKGAKKRTVAILLTNRAKRRFLPNS